LGHEALISLALIEVDRMKTEGKRPISIPPPQHFPGVQAKAGIEKYCRQPFIDSIKNKFYEQFTLRYCHPPGNWMVAGIFCFSCREHYSRLVGYRTYCDYNKGSPGKKGCIDVSGCIVPADIPTIIFNLVINSN
jgi:hypothetical protein